jgi:SAM-dependent methyltransferase
MSSPPQSPAYFQGCNSRLLNAVPAEAMRILDVGCGAGRLGAALKQHDPIRYVAGIERDPGAAEAARGVLDAVYAIDLACDELPTEADRFDAILFGDVLEHLVDPLAALDRLVPRLDPGGCVLCSIPNAQHHSMLRALLTGDLQYQPAGLLDATHLRFFTLSTAMKLLLDAGLEPELIDTIRVPCPPGLIQAAYPLLTHFGLNPRRTADRLDAYQHILRARPMSAIASPAPDPPDPVTFVTCVTDAARLEANLLASPDLAPGSPHEVLAYQHCPSAAEAINRGLELGKHKLCLFAHQDVYLPRGWVARFVAQLADAEKQLGPIGICGVYGVAHPGDQAVRAGRVVDRERLLREPTALPCRAETLDELLLAIPRPCPLRANPDLGFHLYGADLALQARGHGLAAAVLDVPCLHNSRSVGLPPSFGQSVQVFQQRWSSILPVATSCAVIDHEGYALC